LCSQLDEVDAGARADVGPVVTETFSGCRRGAGKELAEAQQRFTAPSQVAAAKVSRQWVLEGLSSRRGARGEAGGAARAGNISARRTLDGLAAALIEWTVGRMIPDRFPHGRWPVRRDPILAPTCAYTDVRLLTVCGLRGPHGPGLRPDRATSAARSIVPLSLNGLTSGCYGFLISDVLRHPTPVKAFAHGVMIVGYVLGSLAWLYTVWTVAHELGPGWAIATFLFPPLDFIMLFVVGTWPVHVPAAVVMFVIGIPLFGFVEMREDKRLAKEAVA
jgi:hypothetical protein